MHDIYDFYLDIETNGERYYTFSTSEAEYTVYFNPNEYINRVGAYPFLLNNAFGFGFFQFPYVPVAVPQPDAKIKHTIAHIITDFYADFPSAVLLYHCFYADGKQHKRSRFFERWYNFSTASDDIRKYEISLDILTDDRYVAHYLGYLCSNSNIDIDAVHREFEDFVLSFPGDKDPNR